MEDMNSYILELQNLYPDKIIFNLSKNPILYYNLCKIARNKNMTLQNFLESIGFTYGKDATVIKMEEEIENGLKRQRGDVVYSSDITQTALYSLISRVAREYGCSVGEYIESLGYKYVKNTNRESKINYASIRRLRTQFNLSFIEIGNMFNVSKQRIEQILKQKRSVITKDLINTEEDYLILQEMIQNYQFECSVGETRYILKNDMNGHICFICYDDEMCRCIFEEDIPHYLIQMINEKRMDYLCVEDIQLLENIVTVQKMKKPHIFLDSQTNKLYKKGAKRHDKSLDEYAIFLGFNGYVTKKDKNIDDKIINFLEDHLIDGEVYISSDPKNQWLKTYISRCGMSIEEFINFFGYKKAKRGKYAELEEHYKASVKKFEQELRAIAVNENEVKIEGNLYQNLRGFCLKNGKNMDMFIKELGFVRLGRKRQFENAKEKLIINQLQELKENINRVLQYENKFYINNEKNEMKRKRNRSLIDKLKKIYECRCQLCSEDSWLPICIDDGGFYCEVHHIKSLSKENEEENLDVLENLIVVCPNHHKMLHYHNSGYEKLIDDHGTLYFYNDSKEKIKVQKNFHLRANN